MTVSEHYGSLVKQLSPHDLGIYNKLPVIRSETAFLKRYFILYEVSAEGKPIELDRVKVVDFFVNVDMGACASMKLQKTGEEFEVAYGPVRIPGYPVFLSLPLHATLKWNTTPSNPFGGSMSFPLGIRTGARHALNLPGVVYCETGVSFGSTFGGRWD